MIKKKNFSVLYVEDELDIRNKYSQYLNRFVTTVYVAQDGKEAYEIYKDKQPDILMADINLPKLNGLDLASKIREKDLNIKIIMLTAHSDIDYLLQATDLKLTKYLIKPVNREDLKNALNLAIDEHLKYKVLSKNIIHLDDNSYWDIENMELFIDSIPVTLTRNEKLLTNFLISNSNGICSYDEIIYEIWPSDFDKLPALKTLVKALRRKLPEECLENIRSTGYRIKLKY